MNTNTSSKHLNNPNSPLDAGNSFRMVMPINIIFLVSLDSQGHKTKF